MAKHVNRKSKKILIELLSFIEDQTREIASDLDELQRARDDVRQKGMTRMMDLYESAIERTEIRLDIYNEIKHVYNQLSANQEEES